MTNGRVSNIFGGGSAEVIEAVFRVYFPERPLTVLDMTVGKGVFWKWERQGIDLTTWDKDERCHPDRVVDWTTPEVMAETMPYDVVVFDPPFAAIGPSKVFSGIAERSGARRGEGLRSIHDVWWLYYAGVSLAVGMARQGVIVKTMNVVESGKYWDTGGYVGQLLHGLGVTVVGHAYQTHRPKPQRLPQRSLDSAVSVYYIGRTTAGRRGRAVAKAAVDAGFDSPPAPPERGQDDAIPQEAHRGRGVSDDGGPALG